LGDWKGIAEDHTSQANPAKLKFAAYRNKQRLLYWISRNISVIECLGCFDFVSKDCSLTMMALVLSTAETKILCEDISS
jgi:hypothetical protein